MEPQPQPHQAHPPALHQPLTDPAPCRRNPEHELKLAVKRGTEVAQVTVTPELDMNGDGRLGVHLGSNVKYRHTKAASLPAAASAASKALARCFSQVVGGERVLGQSCTLENNVETASKALARCFSQVVGGEHVLGQSCTLENNVETASKALARCFSQDVGGEQRVLGRSCTLENNVETASKALARCFSQEVGGEQRVEQWPS